MKRNAATTAIPVAIFIFSALLYGRTAAYDFVWDDAMVLNASKIPLTSDGAKEIFSTPVDRLYRPLRTLTYAVEHSLGAGSREFHVTNAMLYALACFAFFHFILLLSGSLPVASLSSALFAAHPLHAEVVSSISNGRADLLCAVFIFTSLYFFIASPRSIQSSAASLFFFALAALSKESAVIFSGLIFIISFQRKLAEKSPSFSGALKSAAVSALPFLTLSVIYIFIRNHYLGAMSQAAAYHGGSFKNTFLTSMSVVPDYGAALFLPLKQCALYYVPAITSASPKAVLGVFLILSLVAAGSALIRKAPVASFSMLFIFLTWLPASNLIPISTLKAARFMFLPTAGACVLSALIINCAAKSFFSSDRTRAAFIAAAALPALIAYSYAALGASAVWKNSSTLWTHAVTCAPNSPVSWNNYARAIYDDKNTVPSEAAFLKALSINPSFAQPYENLAIIYGNAGRYNDAINMLLKRKSLGASGDIDCKLSFAYKKVGDITKAGERYADCRRALSKER